VLRQLFASAEFAAARGLKVRRPIEHVAATLRALQIGPDTGDGGAINTLLWTTGSMGQQPFAWSTPDGYPERAEQWLATVTTLERWSASRRLVEGWGTGDLTRTDLRAWLFGSATATPATYGDMVDIASKKLFSRVLPSEHRTAICTFLGARPLSPLSTDSSALTWRLRSWVSLLLDTPYHLYR
jgi:hypothetical protein